MNRWIDWLAVPAHAAIVASLLFASFSLAAILLLYIRRRRAESDTEQDRKADRELSRKLIARIETGHGQNIDPAGLDPQQLERVFSNLLQLVRGPDREGLLIVADNMGVPERAMDQLLNRRAARRVDALRILEQFPVPRVIRLLGECMATDPSMMVRTEAAATLTRVGAVPSPAAIIEAMHLRTTSPSLLHAAMFRMGSVQHSSEMAVLASELPTGALRSMIVEALGWSEDFKMLPILADFAQSEDSELRIAGLKAARQLGHPGVRTWVLPMLLDPVDEVRVQAARTCGQLGLIEAIPLLSRLVENSSWWVRTRAAEALALLRAGQPAPFAITGLRK